MNLPIAVNPKELSDILLNIAPIRPVFIWGAPGIGKSSLVEKFADEVGLPCVSLLGSQLAPEDITGIPKIDGEVSRFVPPGMIARKEPYVLFLDELNACSQEVQKAFYSLILEKRVGEYHMPAGSVIIGAGNRAHDSAIVKTMSSALINRLFHVELKPNTDQWLEWGYMNALHPWVLEYISQRPDHLFSEPSKTEDPYSTPRSWHILSDALRAWGDDITERQVRLLANGTISSAHANMFVAYTKQADHKEYLSDIIKGTAKWPSAPDKRDELYFLAQSFRAKLWHDLPAKKKEISKDTQYLAHRAKALMKELAEINAEIAQMVVAEEENKRLPDWFLMEIVRDLPRLIPEKDN